VATLLWEQQTYPTLLQCYNAAFYFLSASTVPRAVQIPTGPGAEPMMMDTTEGTAPGGSDSGSVDRSPKTVNAIAITPQGGHPFVSTFVLFSVWCMQLYVGFVITPVRWLVRITL
jgi:hypothetical protein